MTKTVLSRDYESLLAEVKERVHAAQYQALKAVNKELVGLYWDIGRMIVERQAGETWGKSIVQQLAGDLQKEFPGIKGFSAQNLWYMRQFYLEYQGIEKLQPLVGEIGWSGDSQAAGGRMRRDSAANRQEPTILQQAVAKLLFSTIRKNFEELGV